MTTQEGNNVGVCAIRGNFDDAQDGVKAIFTDKAVGDELARHGMMFSSANSINWGRLVPQIVYYVSAYCDLLASGEVAMGQAINVSGNTLNAILNQRSQDMLTANNWNVVQYAVLVHMLAQVSGLEAGELVHVIADCHIYDRHVPLVEQLLEREPYPAPEFYVNPEVKNFYDFTVDDFRLENYRYHEFREKIPVAI